MLAAAGLRRDPARGVLAPATDWSRRRVTVCLIVIAVLSIGTFLVALLLSLDASGWEDSRASERMLDATGLVAVLAVAGAVAVAAVLGGLSIAGWWGALPGLVLGSGFVVLGAGLWREWVATWWVSVPLIALGALGFEGMRLLLVHRRVEAAIARGELAAEYRAEIR